MNIKKVIWSLSFHHPYSFWVVRFPTSHCQWGAWENQTIKVMKHKQTVQNYRICIDFTTSPCVREISTGMWYNFILSSSSSSHFQLILIELNLYPWRPVPLEGFPIYSKRKYPIYHFTEPSRISCIYCSRKTSNEVWNNIIKNSFRRHLIPAINKMATLQILYAVARGH